jgi:hypothetical protein
MGQPKLSAAPGLTSSPGRREESQDRFSAAPNLGAFKMRREVLHVSLWEVGSRGRPRRCPVGGRPRRCPIGVRAGGRAVLRCGGR